MHVLKSSMFAVKCAFEKATQAKYLSKLFKASILIFNTSIIIFKVNY